MHYSKVLAYLALFFGVLASLSCISISLLFWGLLSSVVGSLFAIFVIFYRTQRMLEIKWNHPAVIALLLNSVPVIYLVAIIFIFKDKA